MRILKLIYGALLGVAVPAVGAPARLPIDLSRVRAAADVTDISLLQRADRWEVHIAATTAVAFESNGIAEGHRFYLDFPGCRLAVGSPTLSLAQGGVTVRAAQFSIDPAIVRVVVQAPDGSAPALATPAPDSEAIIWLPLSARSGPRTRIQISSLSAARSRALARSLPFSRRASARPSRSTLTSRGGHSNRPDPSDLVFHPDALEAYDEPPVPSDGGSLDPVWQAPLPDALRDGVRIALAGTHRYVWGGETPDGFDCSGLAQFIYRQASVRLPRTAAEQYRTGREVGASDLEPGDLVFFSNGQRIFHVAIYIGSGRIFHAANPKRGLTTDLLSKRFYEERYAGARRYLR